MCSNYTLILAKRPRRQKHFSKDKDLFIAPQEFVVGYSKAPEQPQSRAALGLYVILTLWQGRGANQPRYALLHRSSPRYALCHGRRNIFLFFLFWVEENVLTWQGSLKTTTMLFMAFISTPWLPLFLGVLKSQSRTSARPGSIPSRVSYSTPAPFWHLYMQYTQLGSLPWGTSGSPWADSWTFCLYWQKAVGPGIKTHHPPPQLKSNL